MKTVLVVDDEEVNRVALEVGFSSEYEVILASDGKEAIEYFKNGTIIDTVLLDLNMPNINGVQVLEFLYKNDYTSKIPVFIVTSEASDDILETVFKLGAVDIIEKPYNLKILKKRVATQLEFFGQRANLEQKVREKTDEIKRYGFRLVEAMADMVEFRSKEDGLHVKRVRGFSKIILEALIDEYPEYEPYRKDIENITFAACLHDVGKNVIPDYILNKPGKLTSDERALMQTHTTRGYEQIVAMKNFMSPDLYKYCLDIVRHHHERYDGRGYPDGLSGEQISICAQVVGLADAYDALTSVRCYKKAFDHGTSVQMIINGECGGEFNPKILSVFKKNESVLNSFRIAIQNHSPDNNKRILIIDDSAIDREVLCNILNQNFDVIQVENARMGLELINDSRQFFDAIFIDINMPQIDGFKTVEFLGRRFLQQVPVIMMTSETTNRDYIEKAAALGISSFVKKPFNPESVLQKVQSMIEEYSQE